ncbi:MAG: FAD:protein FMN transferase, partial [Chloroflexi bacterium]|nr:FAD:protein FMN transferase [Chloroflexota bacterium]
MRTSNEAGAATVTRHRARNRARTRASFFGTIRFRLTLWFVGVLALVILTISTILYFGLERVLLQSVDANLRAAAQRSVVPADNQGKQTEQQEAGYPEDEEYEHLRQLVLQSNTPARLLSLDGSLLQNDPLFPRGITVTQEMLATANAGSARYETVQAGGHMYRIYTAPLRMEDTRIAIVQVVDALDEPMNTLADLRALLAGLIPLSLVFAGIGGSFLAGRALAPAERVRQDVQTIIEHSDLTHRVSAGLPNDEVGLLARTFDELLARVQQAMERERRFTSDASHELRTPLTVLKGEISVALSRPRDTRDYRQTLARLESTVDDMSQLVEDLLTLTRASSNTLPLPQTPVNVSDLLEQVCERLRVIADGKGITLNRELPPGRALVTLGDRIKLQRVFVNLIDNATRYTPTGGHVDVGARHSGQQVVVEVRDTGRGIAPEHLPSLFQRFYRADSGRARESGGSGLGLAIARTIARAHGGDITVTSQLGRGSCFTVTLPAMRPPLAATPALTPSSSSAETTGMDIPMSDHKPEMARPQAQPVPKPSAAGARQTLYERAFRAMNTDIHLLLLSHDERRANCVLDAAEWFFVQVEWRLSRFRESSELSTLNRQGRLRASRLLLEVLWQAARAYADTGGCFNPLIGPALITAGYNRTFDEIGTDHVFTTPGAGPHTMVPPFTDAVTVEPASGTVSLVDGAQLDLGGIAKGWAVDRAFRTLAKLGPCCVNAGGDVRVGGSFHPNGDGWQVDIADPFAPETEAGARAAAVRVVTLCDRAIATSGIMKRRWIVAGEEQHHLIDPRTGRPAHNELLFVSAIADTAVQAEVAAKTAFILGEEEGSLWLEARHIPALIMFRNGEYLCNEWFPQG